MSFGISPDKILATRAMNIADEAEKTEKANELKRKRNEYAEKIIEAAKEFNKYSVELLQLNTGSKFQEAIKLAEDSVQNAPENKKTKREKLVQDIIARKKTFIDRNSTPLDFIETGKNNIMKLNMYQSRKLAEDGITPIPTPKPTPPKQSIPPVTPKSAKSQNTSSTSNSQPAPITNTTLRSRKTTRIQARPPIRPTNPTNPPYPPIAITPLINTYIPCYGPFFLQTQQNTTPHSYTSPVSTPTLFPSPVTSSTKTSPPIPSTSYDCTLDDALNEATPEAIHNWIKNAGSKEYAIKQYRERPVHPMHTLDVMHAEILKNYLDPTANMHKLSDKMLSDKLMKISAAKLILKEEFEAFRPYPNNK